jgi:hypothetical protein
MFYINISKVILLLSKWFSLNGISFVDFIFQKMLVV